MPHLKNSTNLNVGQDANWPMQKAGICRLIFTYVWFHGIVNLIFPFWEIYKKICISGSQLCKKDTALLKLKQGHLQIEQVYASISKKLSFRKNIVIN